MSRYAGFGVSLAVDDGLGGGFVDVAQVRDLAGPGLANDTIEVTDRDGGGWKEFLGGLKDGGEITLDVTYDPAGSTHNATSGLVHLYGGALVVSWRITWPDSTVWTLNGLVTNFEPKAPLADALVADVTIKVSGQPTLA